MHGKNAHRFLLQRLLWNKIRQLCSLGLDSSHSTTHAPLVLWDKTIDLCCHRLNSSMHKFPGVVHVQGAAFALMDMHKGSRGCLSAGFFHCSPRLTSSMHKFKGFLHLQGPSFEGGGGGAMGSGAVLAATHADKAPLDGSAGSLF